MGNFLEVLFKLLEMFVLLFLAIITNVLLGALIGWAVGLLFGTTILAILAQIGIVGFKM